MADIKYVITVDEQGATTSIKTFAEEIDGLGKAGKDTDSKAQSLFATIAGASIVADAAGKAMGMLTDFVAGAGEEFREGEKVQSDLIATMRSLGIDTDANRKRFDDFSGTIADMTTIDDDMAKSLVSLGLRMRISSDQIESATTNAIGLSKAFGVDLEGAMKMVAQATNGNYDMMGRYLPQLKGAETGSEKAAIAAKAMADGLKIAQAETQTTGGQMEQAKNKINNAKEEIGAFTTKVETLAYKALVPATRLLAEFINQLAGIDDTGTKDRLGKQWQEDFDALSKASAAAGRSMDRMAAAYGDIGFSHTEQGARNLEDALSRLVSRNAEAARAYSEYVKAQKAGVDPTRNLALGTGDAAKATKTLAESMGLVTRQTLEKKIGDITTALRKYGKDMPVDQVYDLRKEQDKLLKQLDSIDKKYDGLPKPIGDTSKAIANMVPPLNAAGTRVKGFAAEWDSSMGKVSASTYDAMGKALNNIAKVAQGFSSAISAIDAAIDQSYTNKQIAMDNDYQRQLENIKNSTKSEEEKQIAITALESDYNMKRRELAKKEAEAKKLTAIANAIISTATGVAKAWEAGPILGPILAAIVAAAGAIQIAKIKSQPIPLAQGAIFKQPTFLTSPNSGQDYHVAEAGEAEIISSPSRLRKAIGLSDGGGGRAIKLTLPIYIGGKLLQTQVIDIVEDQSQLGRLRIAGKAVN